MSLQPHVGPYGSVATQPLLGAYPIRYNPGAMASRATTAREVSVSRVISLAITAIVWVVLVKLFPNSFGEQLPLFIAASSALPVVLLAIALVKQLLIGREIKATNTEVACVFDAQGITTAQGHTLWQQVSSVQARPGSWGRSRKLIFNVLGAKPITVRLDYMHDAPASVHNTIWAVTNGAYSVDFSALKV